MRPVTCAVAAMLFASLPVMPLIASDAARRESPPPIIERRTIGDVQIEVRFGGRLVAPQDLAALQPPRSIRGSMLPTLTQLMSVRVAPEVMAIVPELDAESWSVRESAAERLRAAPVADEQLLAVIAQLGPRGDLSAEQWHRILEIVCDRLRMAPRGALGIRMDRRWDGIRGVLITDLLPGMPAAHTLRVGDRIIEIDGRPIMESEDLIELVQLRRPGERVNVRVARPRRDDAGREIAGRNGMLAYDEVATDIALGDADDLDRFGDGLGNQFGDAGPGNRSGSVSRLRAEQAAEARSRFALPATQVRISGPRPTAEMTILPDPDDHEAMTTLRLYRQLLDEGAITATPAMRRAWQGTLRLLEEQAADATLTEALRAHYREIARRYAELIPAR